MQVNQLSSKSSNLVLPTIVIAQFFCTSLWFAGNAIMPDIISQYQIEPAFLAHLTSTVQLGFIIGTLIFSILSISDRFSPSRIFFVCAIVVASINLAISLQGINLSTLVCFRFLTGFFLAGIYPIGMKIASDHYQQGLGKSLGFLVGALVIGTAFPHILKSIPVLPWRYVIFSTSLLAALGGLAMFLLVPDGPYRSLGQKLKLGAFLKCFANKKFRAASFGYFGHMWELYAFWTFVPMMLITYKNHHPTFDFNISFLSFLIIGIGSIACVFSGLISQHFGTKKVATIALALSGLCCIISPILLFDSSATVFIIFLLLWGMAVIADSPLFSTLVAQNAIAELKGTALTIVNCIGFAITIISIQLINALSNTANVRFIYLWLAIGPIFGLVALLNNKE